MTIEEEIRRLSESLVAHVSKDLRVNLGYDGACGIYFDNKNAAYPFAKVEKQLRNGPEDSILSFYEMIPIVFDRLGTSPTDQVDVLDSQ